MRISVCKANLAVSVTLAVFATAADFSAQRSPIINLSLLPQADGMATGEIALPPGRYAIAAFQDEDDDRQLTRNMLGLPVEPYGFSGKSGRFGQPTFSDATFFVPAIAPVLVCLQTI